MASNFLKELSAEQKDLSLRIFDLVIGRVLKIVYSSLSEKSRENMEKIFISGDEKEREEFIKKNIPNFKKLFKEESKKIEKEIKTEIEKQAQ